MQTSFYLIKIAQY